MAEGMIIRRGGSVKITYFKSRLSNESSLEVSGLSADKRYIIATARHDDYDSYTGDAIATWMLDHGTISKLGGMYWYTGDVNEREEGCVGQLTFDPATGYLRYSSSHRVSLAVIELG